MYAQLDILQDGVCDVITIKEQVKCSKNPSEGKFNVNMGLDIFGCFPKKGDSGVEF